MNYLSENLIENKRVILRCDFNVPVKDGVILDNSKIIKSLKTINYLLDNNNKVIILSHFGRVKSESDKANNSLKIVHEELKKHINVIFNPSVEEIDDTLFDGNNCILVENTRFTDVPEKKESINDLTLAHNWAEHADVFVLDAFGSSHRVHSSTAGIANYLPTYIGFLMEEEIKNLSILINNTPHPFIVVMGGVKVDDKIDIILSLIEKCNKLVLTGGILNSFLKQKGINIGKSLVNSSDDVSNNINMIINKYSHKLVFSKKFVTDINILKETDITELTNDDTIFDNIIEDKSIFDNAKLIFINGTCGLYEKEEYSKGTKKLLEILSLTDALVIAGGGDTASAIKKFGYNDTFKYISSGGGATLEYIANGTLKAIEYITNL